MRPLTKNPRLNPSVFSDRYWIQIKMRDCLRSIAARHLRPSKDSVLIDFGCGSEPYRVIFEPSVGKYIGVDLETNRAADYHVTSDSRTNLPDQCCEVVLSTQVLEHVTDPSIYLSECRRMLKPGGLLVLSTHGYWMYHPNPQDYWRWTGSGLRKLLKDSGFKIDDFHGIMGLASAGLHLFQDGVCMGRSGFWKSILALLMQPLIGVADGVCSEERRLQDACVYIAVARKEEE